MFCIKKYEENINYFYTELPKSLQKEKENINYCYIELPKSLQKRKDNLKKKKIIKKLPIIEEDNYIYDESIKKYNQKQLFDLNINNYDKFQMSDIDREIYKDNLFQEYLNSWNLKDKNITEIFYSMLKYISMGIDIYETMIYFKNVVLFTKIKKDDPRHIFYLIFTDFITILSKSKKMVDFNNNLDLISNHNEVSIILMIYANLIFLIYFFNYKFIYNINGTKVENFFGYLKINSRKLFKLISTYQNSRIFDLDNEYYNDEITKKRSFLINIINKNNEKSFEYVSQHFVNNGNDFEYIIYLLEGSFIDNIVFVSKFNKLMSFYLTLLEKESNEDFIEELNNFTKYAIETNDSFYVRLTYQIAECRFRYFYHEIINESKDNITNLVKNISHNYVKLITENITDIKTVFKITDLYSKS